MHRADCILVFLRTLLINLLLLHLGTKLFLLCNCILHKMVTYSACVHFLLNVSECKVSECMVSECMVSECMVSECMVSECMYCAAKNSTYGEINKTKGTGDLFSPQVSGGLSSSNNY